MKSDASITNKSTKQIARQVGSGSARNYSLLPLLPPFLRVLSVGTGVTSSMRPIFMPERARALSAD